MDRGLTSYQSALEKLFARTGSTAKFGLDRTRALLAELGNPHEDFHSFHVAGTNGKGSVVATLDTLLRAKHFRVGRYTSPHLIDFRERISVDGKEITDEEVSDFLDRVEAVADKLGATFFEITTALAFHHFSKSGVDVAAIEAGLGGRLDSTNVITPLAAAVTSVGLDHTEYLGNTIAEIAREKAGIFKENIPAVYGRVNPEAKDALEATARQLRAQPIVNANETYAVGDVHLTPSGTQFEAERDGEHVTLTSGLIGEVQAANTCVALAMTQAAGGAYEVTLDEAREILPSVRLRGRFQRLGKYILDVAHNPDGMRAFVDTLQAVHPPAPIFAVLGVLRDKDWRTIMKILCARVACTLLVTPPSAPADRAWSSQEAEDFGRDRGWNVKRIDDLSEALEFASNEAATVVATGSFHTVGDTLRLIE